MDVSFGLDPVGWILAGLQTWNDYQRQEYEKEADARNFEYQKQLQQQIFAREDNALQRRMSDAEKAGLNPFSVANGSGAGAGAVVSKNSTPSLPSLGGIVDQYAALRRMPYEMKNLQEGVKQAQAETRIAESNATAAEYQNMFNTANVLMSLGVPTSVRSYLGKDGDTHVWLDADNSFKSPIIDTPFGQNYLNQNYLNYGKAAELQKVLQYYDVSEIGGMVMPLLKLLLGK